MKLGVLLKEHGNYQEALREFHFVERLRPHIPMVLFYTGMTFKQMGRCGMSVQYLNRFLKDRRGNRYPAKKEMAIAAIEECGGDRPGRRRVGKTDGIQDVLVSMQISAAAAAKKSIMNKTELTKLLQNVRSGKTDIETALKRLKHLPFEDVAYAHIDHHRHLRHGMPEVIYCEGKTLDQVVGIAKRMLKAGSDILATRASEPCL